jgi:hypothetical protein
VLLLLLLAAGGCPCSHCHILLLLLCGQLLCSRVSSWGCVQQQVDSICT